VSLRAPGESWSDAIRYHRFALIARVARVVPTRTGRALAKLGGTIAFHVAGGARRVVATNMAQVLGRAPDDPLVRGTTREAFQLYARYWYDLFHIGGWTDRQVLDATRFEGMDELFAAIERGTGVIIALPHIGNYDVAGRAVVASGIPVVCVVEMLEPRRLTELFIKERRDVSGMEVLPLTKDAHVGQRLAAALKANKAIALMADRDLTGRGLAVEMFGRERRIPIGPAMLSISSGAPIVVAEPYQVADGWTLRMRPLDPVPLTGDRRTDVTAISAELARVFEEGISASPPDWHLFQPGWED
jgi:KDO2-lipid IV(A) lauroyltransferase